MTTDAPKLQLDYGQAEIGAFLEGARNGQFNFNPDAVRQMVAVYDTLLAVLTNVRKDMKNAVYAKGFGGFESAQELQAGFGGKAAEGIDAIDQVIVGILDLQEAHLRSARLVTEVDELSQKRIRLAEEGIGA
ncbi:hypothetical protein ACTWPB_25255 [Nocardia sp. IBHARD005]|uniref:hypothetical protein n=1 Tax=Nocardia sp. IBHARD005 TaxID=3457765 RepID=UPI004059CA55